jgi:hypothetical protein
VCETLGHSQRKVYPVRSRNLSTSNIKHNYAFVVFQLSGQILKTEVECHENFFLSHGMRRSPLGTATTVWCIVPAPEDDDDECGAVGGMRISRGNRSTRRKSAPVPLCPPRIPYDLTRARTRAAAVGSRRLTALTVARSQ